MMRQILLLVFVITLVPSVEAQRVGNSPSAASGGNAAGRKNAAKAGGQQGVEAPPKRPFPPLSAEQQAQLQQLLAAWETQSQETETLECRFKCWSYDPFAAPAMVPATEAQGVIKYAAPDKGLFRVDKKLFFQGMKDDKPTYEEQPGKFGDWWVCTGEMLIEFDRGRKECRRQVLPPEMRGKRIFNSPLPFVFNLDAQQIQQRYWVRQAPAPKSDIVLIEAWPKRQRDRAQYRVVQVALNKESLHPVGLVMYAPNFDQKKNPKWDHYEFYDVSRNSIGQGLQNFLRSFIKQDPPADWTILNDSFSTPGGNDRTARAEKSSGIDPVRK